MCIYIYVYIYIYLFIEPGPRNRTASRPTWYGCPPPPKPCICKLFAAFRRRPLQFVLYLQDLGSTASYLYVTCSMRATTSSLNPVYRHISNISILHMLPKTCLCTACSVPHTWFTTHCMPLCYMFAVHRLYTQSAPMHTYIILYIICLDGVCT